MCDVVQGVLGAAVVEVASLFFGLVLINLFGSFRSFTLFWMFKFQGVSVVSCSQMASRCFSSLRLD